MSNRQLIQTTAGDWEREARSRRWNGLEALGLITLILVVLWPFCYWLGVYGDRAWVRSAAYWPLIGGAVFILFVSPFVHRDTLESWGLGHPRVLWRMLTSGPAWKRAALATLIAALFLALNYVNYARWPDVARFFQMPRTARALNEGFPGLFFVFGFGGVISALLLTFCVRYDNFFAAFATALKIALPMFAVVCVGAFLQRGAEAFSGFDLGEFALGVFGYLFWGFTQQLLFSSYFGTRFRKAFGPSEAQGAEGVWRTAALFGLGTAAIAAPTLFLGLRWAYPEDPVSPVSMAWTALCAFPIGAVYGYFFTRDRKRLLVATLSASCFGLIHIDSYGLVLVTWILGITLVYVFMEDRNRNLVALGFIHGLNGSTLNWLFSKGESGTLEIDYNVGPWNVDVPTLGTVFFPLVCIAVYGALMTWFYRTIRD